MIASANSDVGYQKNFLLRETFVNCTEFFTEFKELFISHSVRVNYVLFTFALLYSLLNKDLFLHLMLMSLLCHQHPNMLLLPATVPLRSLLLLFLKLHSNLKRNEFFVVLGCWCHILWPLRRLFHLFNLSYGPLIRLWLWLLCAVVSDVYWLCEALLVLVKLALQLQIFMLV